MELGVPERLNLDHAREVALILIRHPLVRGVEIFGSVARKGSGKDLDLIIVVSEEIASVYIDRAKEIALNEFFANEVLAGIEAYAPTDTRIKSPLEEAIIEALGEPVSDLLDEARGILPPSEKLPLDIVLLPPDWRTWDYKDYGVFGPDFFVSLREEAKPLVKLKTLA